MRHSRPTSILQYKLPPQLVPWVPTLFSEVATTLDLNPSSFFLCQHHHFLATAGQTMRIVDCGAFLRGDRRGSKLKSSEDAFTTGGQVVRKWIVLALTLVVLLCALFVDAGAQQSCTAPFYTGSYSQWDATLFPFIPPGASHCWSPFGFTLVCTMQSYKCAPHADDVCPSCPRGGSPIALSTGNTYVQETDLRVPGLSHGLVLDRVWNSRTAYAQGLFGKGWRSNLEESVFVGSENYISYWRGDDSIWSFGYYGLDPAGTGYSIYWTAAPANAGAVLQTGPTYWTLTLKDGEKRLFDIQSGVLTSIIDRNGNTTQLSYDGYGRLITITDPAARHLYLNYAGSGTLVQTVTTDFGVSLSYTYDSQQRLVQVTYPDTTFKTFQYDANSFITAVKDSQGKTLESHTYNTCGQGLTSSQAGGVEAVTITYPQSCAVEQP